MARHKNISSELTQVGVWSWRSNLLWTKIQKGTNSNDCWIWLGNQSKHANLFGVYKNGLAQMTQAQRIIHREVTGEDCEEVSFKHSCGDRWCCNPDHKMMYPNNRKYFKEHK